MFLVISSMPKAPEAPADQPDELGPLAISGADSPSPAVEDHSTTSLAPEAPAGRRLPITMIGVAAAAGLLGVTVGLALAPGSRTPAPVASAPAADQVKVLVETKPAPTPQVGPPMPTLQGLPAAAPASPAKAATPPKVAPEPAPPSVAVAPPAPRPNPVDMACAYAAADPASGCRDPELIEIDRELYAAYQAARRVGVPLRELRDDQEDWRVASAAAAAESRAALLDAYRGRVEQVWSLVEQWDRRGERRFGRSRFR